MNYLTPLHSYLFVLLRLLLKYTLVVVFTVLLVLFAYSTAIYFKLPSVDPLVSSNSQPIGSPLQFDDIPQISGVIVKSGV